MPKFNTFVNQEYGEEEEDEVDELIPSIIQNSSRGGGTKTIIIKQQSNNSNAAVWRAMTIILLGIVLLFLTDSIELKRASKGGGGDGVVAGGVAGVYGDGETTIKKDPAIDDVSSPVASSSSTDQEPPVTAPSPVAVTAPVKEDGPQPTVPEETQDMKPTTSKDVPKDESTPPPVVDVVDEPEPTKDVEVKEEEPTTPAAAGATTAGTGSASSSTDDDSLSSTYIGRRTYKRRGQPLTDDEKKEMIDKWGSWTLTDTKDRPTDDYYMKYPNRDIPRTEFPSNAWQIDKEYLDKFLPESLNLVERTLKAIWAEYGHDYPNDENGKKLFVPEFLPPFNETKDDNLGVGRRGKITRESVKMAGWTNTKSFEGLKRRLLHAIMTEDSFIFAMGGHSAAAGHGNTFSQSYTLQVQWILEAVFARLGVRHESRNFGNGGLGTIQHGVAAASNFGPDVDMIMWDSGMTEGDASAKEVIYIQQALGGSKVPAYWTLAGNEAKMLHMKADVDVGYPGDGIYAMTEAESIDQVEKMPWAAQYVRCNSEMRQICRDNEYIAECWIDRDDFTPSTTQKKVMGGRAGWHPGNRIHQIRGRIIASHILQALRDAIIDWKEAPNYELPDDAWHVTTMYDNVRAKLKALPEDGGCQKGLAEFDMEWTCKYPVKSRTEFTPRAYPPANSIRSIMPEAQRKELNDPPETVYMPPDVFNPSLHPPKGAIDVLNIAEAGVDFASILNPDYHSKFYKTPKFTTEPIKTPGKGFMLGTYAGDDYCSGSVDSWCNKGPSQDCLLYGHNDGRNGIEMDGYSGWMVMNIPDLRNGFISIKLETWHWPKEMTKTADWTTENNEPNTRSLVRRDSGSGQSIESDAAGWSDERMLKEPVTEYCEEFKFEYSIDGKMEVSLNLEEWKEKHKQVARVVETVTLLKDPNFVPNGEEREVQLAFRLTGCGKVKVFKISHVYWS